MASIRLSDDLIWFGARWIFFNIMEEAIPKVSSQRLKTLMQEAIDSKLGGIRLLNLPSGDLAEFITAVDTIHREAALRPDMPELYGAYINKTRELLQLLHSVPEGEGS